MVVAAEAVAVGVAEEAARRPPPPVPSLPTRTPTTTRILLLGEERSIRISLLAMVPDFVIYITAGVEGLIFVLSLLRAHGRMCSPPSLPETPTIERLTSSANVKLTSLIY